jgi:hypothetical protein
LNKFCDSIEIFKALKDKINDKLKDKYEEWSSDYFKEIIELIIDIKQKVNDNDKEILKIARIEIGKIIIPTIRFNNDYYYLFF